MTKVHDVTGIGHALVDIIATAEDSLISELKLTKGTMRLTSAEEAMTLYERMGPASEASGGSAANTCAGIASFGGTVSFMGKLGQDDLGTVFTHDIRSIGVTFAPPQPSTEEPTGSCLILVTPDGERTMNTNLGAAALFSEGDLDGDTIASAKVVYLEGYLFDPQDARKAFHAAAGVARRSGTQVAFTLSDPFCVDRHREAFRAFIRDSVDIVFANESELLSLYPGATFEAACNTISADCKIAAITRSEKGSFVFTGQNAYKVEAELVDRVVDATGAGDLYAAGFLTGYTRGLELPACGALGSLAAAEVIGHFGPRPQRSLKALAIERGVLER